jgi:hypothetical protein
MFILLCLCKKLGCCEGTLSYIGVLIEYEEDSLYAGRGIRYANNNLQLDNCYATATMTMTIVLYMQYCVLCEAAVSVSM